MSSDKAGHWYTSERAPAHKQENKSRPGETRPTTLRDAKAQGLLPSVTTVIGVLDRPQLTTWKLEQVAAAAYGLVFIPKLQYATLEDWTGFIIDQAFKQVETAADLGIGIHAAIEAWAQGKPYDPAMTVYVEAVAKWAASEQVTFVSNEEVLVDPDHGYAGTTDATIACPRGKGILDFKSRKTKPGLPATPFDGQPMQVAAYHNAKFGSFAPDHVGVNLFISTTEPGRVDATWYTSDQLQREWSAFAHALALWKHLKGYDPAAPVVAKAKPAKR